MFKSYRIGGLMAVSDYIMVLTVARYSKPTE